MVDMERTAIRLPEQMLERIKATADAEGISTSEWIRSALRHQLTAAEMGRTQLNIHVKEHFPPVPDPPALPDPPLGKSIPPHKAVHPLQIICVTDNCND